MEKFSRYGDPRLQKAAIILASMSPDMLDDILLLVQARGQQLRSDLFGPNGDQEIGGMARPLAIFSRSYVKDHTFPAVYTGFTLLALAEFRKPRVNNDMYEQVLMNAFNMPPALAASIATKIDTEDVIGGQNGLDSIAEYGDKLLDIARKVINHAAGILPFNWEISQTQKYDHDFLYELKLLGDAADELSQRMDLMSGQALLIANTGLLAVAGDPDEDYQDVADKQVGDVFGALAKGNLPANVMGGVSPVAQSIFNSTRNLAANMVKEAGVSNNNPAEAPATEKGARWKATLGKIAKGAAPAAVAVGSGLVGYKLAKGLSDLVKKNKMSGDPEYGDIADVYGEEVAAAMQSGDPIAVFDAVMDGASEVVTTGDPELDEALEIQAANEGDPNDETEIGGIFKRLRANQLRKKAQRIGGRKDKRVARKTSRYNKRASDQAALDYARSLRNMQLQRSAQAEAAEAAHLTGEEDFNHDLNQQIIDEGFDNSEEGNEVFVNPMDYGI